MTKRIGLWALASLAVACDCGSTPELDDMDVVVDLGNPDLADAGVGPDAGPDMAPPPTCPERGFGINCTTVMGCREGMCQPALTLRDIGGLADPIDGLAGGGDTIPGAELFDNGFCTRDSPFDDAEDCREVEGLCGECMTCVTAFGEGGCYLDCDPSAPGNDVCPEFWDCIPLNSGDGVCFDGCARDTDCFGDALIREETNGVPGIQTGDDCAEAPNPCGIAGPDQLVFVSTADPVCDLDTFECVIRGDADAEAGDRCRGDAECEDDGQCRDENRAGDVIVFEGGYCFGPECTSDDDCNGDGVCGGGRSGGFLTDSTDRCLVRCDLSLGVDAGDPSSWPAGRGGCDEGYKCLSDASAETPELGVCVPDRVDPFSANGAITQPFGAGPSLPNLGAPCRSSDECFNPFGYGTCLVGLNGRDGICTVEEASVLEAAGFDVCTGDALEVNTSAPPANEQQCLPTCASGDECPTGFGCVSAGTERVCFPTGCEASSECRAGEECIAGGCFDTCPAGACGEGLGCLPLSSLFDVPNSDPVCFDVCQSDAQCSGDQVCAGETAEAFGTCITACADATECAPGQACVDFDGMSGGERECRDACTLDTECRSGESCADGSCTPS